MSDDGATDALAEAFYEAYTGEGDWTLLPEKQQEGWRVLATVQLGCVERLGYTIVPTEGR